MPNRTRLTMALLVPCLVLIAAAASRAGANDERPVSEFPVEVVATRTPEAPHSVPASIEVISGRDLRARGVATLKDALALATGLAVAPGGDAGPGSAVVEFWGLREFDAFLLVVDGIPWGGAFNPAVSTLSLRDVERVEILRGPAPVTYGATSFVGVVNVVHKAAAANDRHAEVRGGTIGAGSGAFDLPLLMSTAWKSRLTGDVERQGFADDHTSVLRGHGLWRTERVDGERRLWFTGDVNVLRQDPASPHPREGTGLSSNVPLDANYNPAKAFIDETRLFGALGMERPVMHGARWSATGSFTHSGQSMFRGFLTDLSNTPDNASGFKETIDINDAYADTHILWPSKANVQVMTGTDLLFANGEAKGATFTYTVPLNGSSQTTVAEPTTLDQDAEARRTFFGAYTSAEWRPVSRATISGGLRLNGTSERRGESGGVSHARLSGQAGALVGLWERGADHVRLFANYRDTFKPAAFDFSLAENEGILKPETARSVEGGLKARGCDGRADVEVSAFRMDFKNLVTATVVNNLPALTNAGHTRFQGVELAVDLRLAHATFARASYSAHDGKFVDYVQDFGGVNTQLAGNRVEMSAKHLASLGVTLAPERGLIVNLGVNYTGDRFLNKRNTAKVPAFATVDAGVGYRLERAEFRVDGKNLGDRRDAVSESEFGDAQYYRMTARSVQAGVVLKY